MNGIYELESWKNYSKKLPLVAVIGLVNEWMTIYPCLQQAIKVFDQIMVVSDGADKKTLQYFEQFREDYKNQIEGKVHLFDLENFDPWPWLSLYDASKKYTSIEELPIKAQSKADYKRIALAKSLYGNSIICSLHSDIIVFDDSRDRIIERMSNIANPLFDSEWFTLVTLYDRNNAKTFLSKDSAPGNMKKDPDLNQRTVYDYPGDWGLMSIYGSSMLLPGPDPLYPFAGCLWPWSRKTQMEKKGQDGTAPHAVHLEHIRDRGNNVTFDSESWSFWKTERFENEDPELHRRLRVLDDLNFPVDFWLDDGNTLRIKEK